MARERRYSWWIAGVCVFLTVVGVTLRDLKWSHKTQVPQSWRNLGAVGTALNRYRLSNGFLPYDARGPDYALYLLSDYVSAPCFNTLPHHRVNTRARWDHVNKRLIGSDLEYLNMQFIGREDASLIVLSEVPQDSERWIWAVTCDGRAVSCRRRKVATGSLVGNFVSQDEFIFKERGVLLEWEAVPLPLTDQGGVTVESDASEGATRRLRRASHDFGRIVVEYDYEGGELVRRTFQSPNGTIVDTITTDELGRIVAFTRDPSEWERFWPLNHQVR